MLHHLPARLAPTFLPKGSADHIKTLLTLTLLLLSNIGFSQLKSVVIDRETKERIPYVNIWVENENIGTTSNLNGEFELAITQSKTIIFSAIGFETRKTLSDSIKSVVELSPMTTELGEVTIRPKNQIQTLTLGKVKKSKINSYFRSGPIPWIAARYFPYEETYDKTPFLEKLRFLTNSNLPDSKFNIRLYGVNSDGEPEGYLFDKNIFGFAKKGKKLTEIDLSGFNLQFPEEGFFVAIEWLIVDDNEYRYTYTQTGSSKKLRGISYEPAIGTISTETGENSWIFAQGHWVKPWKNRPPEAKGNKGEYSLLAIELTLTN